MSYKWRYWGTPFSAVKKPVEEDLPISERQKSVFLLLPTEILQVIAKFLSVKDILSCSATCCRLRAAFNDNAIWEDFCRQYIVSYFVKARKKVKVDYDLSFLTYDLDPICEQRVQYMRQNQLLNNWKNGKYVEHTVHASSGLYYMSLKSGTPVIYKDIYLFLYDFHAHNIVVWNIEDIPIPYTKIRLLYHNYFYEGLHYEISGDRLVVVEVGKLIQIYKVSLPDKALPLVSIILVDNDVPLNKIPDFHNPEEMYTICYHKIIDSKVYSHKVGKPVLHIWDIEKGTKIRALEPPKHGCDFDLLSATNKGNDLILNLKINDPQRVYNPLGVIYEVFSYSFSRDFFKTLWTNKEGCFTTYIPFHAVQHLDLVILFCRLNEHFVEDKMLPKTVLILYDYKWAMVIGEKSFPELVCHRQSKVVNNQLLLATAFCIYIMNLNNQEIEYSFKYDSGKIELLDVFDGNFIITTPKSLVSISKTKRKEIWDIKNRKRCGRVTYLFMSAYSKDSIFVNQSFTKMVVVGKGTLGVLHFW